MHAKDIYSVTLHSVNIDNLAKQLAALPRLICQLGVEHWSHDPVTATQDLIIPSYRPNSRYPLNELTYARHCLMALAQLHSGIRARQARRAPVETPCTADLKRHVLFFDCWEMRQRIQAVTKLLDGKRDAEMNTPAELLQIAISDMRYFAAYAHKQNMPERDSSMFIMSGYLWLVNEAQKPIAARPVYKSDLQTGPRPKPSMVVL